MKPTTHLLTGVMAAVLPLLALTVPNTASALPITLDFLSADFSNAQGVGDASPPSNIEYSTDPAEVRFGVPTGNTAKSGLRFDVSDVPIFTSTDTAFDLGTLTHFNWEVKSGTSITAVDLEFTLNVEGTTSDKTSFLFILGVEETANSGSCQYPGNSVCPDKISFPDTLGSSTFTLNGQLLTLALLGFGDNPNDLMDAFYTDESQENTTKLWATISAPVATVSGPGSLFAMALGLFGLASIISFRRRFSTNEPPA